MAAPVDRVRPLKTESVAEGGSSDGFGFPDSVNRNEDALDVHGVFIQSTSSDDETTYITRDGTGNMVFRDAADATERTLTDLVGGAAAVDPAYRRHFLLMGG